jgi:hypothetical protein
MARGGARAALPADVQAQRRWLRQEGAGWRMDQAGRALESKNAALWQTDSTGAGGDRRSRVGGAKGSAVLRALR